MKKSYRIFILAIFLVFICCVGAASAAEIDDAVGAADETAISQEVPVAGEQNTLASSEVEVDNANDNQNALASSDVNDNLKGNSSEYVIWVGPNENDGNGSESNPYQTLELACNSVGEHKDKITVNIFEGTYIIGSLLTFNTSDLHINGLGGKVVLKNLYNTMTDQQSFGLVESGNFTMSNVIFDGSDYTQRNTKNSYFTPIIGSNLFVLFENCTFTGYNGNLIFILPYSAKDTNFNDIYQFVGCKLVNFSIGQMGNAFGANVTFQHCIITAGFTSAFGLMKANEVIFDGCWFGKNNLKEVRAFFIPSSGKPRWTGYSFAKYAIFEISENYLGDNKYEIIGRLMWNDSTTDDIDKLGVMAVNLNSTTGVLNQTTAILENGIFKVLYTSNSSNHTISAVLDSQEVNLNFKNIDMSLNVPSITYGDDQNITVTLPDEYNGVIFVTVNNKTYNKTIELTDSVIVNIPDILSAGTYDVTVTFVDTIDYETCHIYGFNTTTITVAKVSDYDFDATVNPASLYVGDSATVALVLPADATGNVSVKVGDGEAKIFDVDDLISINEFVAGNNTVNITYLGNDKYVSKSVVKTVSASLKATVINASDVSTTYNVAKDLIITLTDVDGKVLANKVVNVVVGDINENLTTNASGQVALDVSKLTPNTYAAAITFLGDEAYVNSTASASVVVNKVASKITAPAVSTTYNVAKNLIVTLKDAQGNVLANQKVTIKIGTTTKTLKTNNYGKVTLPVGTLVPKTYNAAITFAGDSIYAKATANAKVVVLKATPKLIAATKATYKVKTKIKQFAVVLKTNKGKALAKVKVSLKVRGVTYYAYTNAYGKAIFKITKLAVAGNHVGLIKFAGNNYYKAISKKAILIVKK